MQVEVGIRTRGQTQRGFVSRRLGERVVDGTGDAAAAIKRRNRPAHDFDLVDRGIGDFVHQHLLVAADKRNAVDQGQEGIVAVIAGDAAEADEEEGIVVPFPAPEEDARLRPQLIGPGAPAFGIGRGEVDRAHVGGNLELRFFRAGRQHHDFFFDLFAGGSGVFRCHGGKGQHGEATEGSRQDTFLQERDLHIVSVGVENFVPGPHQDPKDQPSFRMTCRCDSSSLCR